MATNVTIQSTSVATQSGSRTINVSISCVNSIGQTQDVTFASAGTVNVTSPTGATVAIISPPPANAVALTWNGTPINPSMPYVHTYASPGGSATFPLTAAGGITGVVEIAFC